AELGASRAIFGGPRDIEPISVDTVARSSNDTKNIIRNHVLAVWIGADTSQDQHFRVRSSCLRCRLHHKMGISLSVAFRALRLDTDDVGITRGVAGDL